MASSQHRSINGGWYGTFFGLKLEEQVVVPENINASIPNDTATRLAYAEWRQKDDMMGDHTATALHCY